VLSNSHYVFPRKNTSLQADLDYSQFPLIPIKTYPLSLSFDQPLTASAVDRRVDFCLDTRLADYTYRKKSVCFNYKYF
jgi:hypothetical protein